MTVKFSDKTVLLDHMCSNTHSLLALLVHLFFSKSNILVHLIVRLKCVRSLDFGRRCGLNRFHVLLMIDLIILEFHWLRYATVVSGNKDLLAPKGIGRQQIVVALLGLDH